MKPNEKAEKLFNQFCKEEEMDKDDIRAARWYKDGMIEFAKWILEQQTYYEHNDVGVSIKVLKKPHGELDKNY